jgi:MFS family permease
VDLAGVEGGSAVIETRVPARLDRLPWSRFHWLVVAALGVAWILDGLEVTLVGSLSSVLRDPRALNLTETEVGLSASAYLAGAVIGAVVFGRLTDAFGRKRLFTVTVVLYLAATVASGCAFNFWSFALCRFLTGAGIGGEYSAVNSAIQELIPARRRGQTDLIINGSYWVGAALGAFGTVVVLDPKLFPVSLGWRLAFLIGGALGLIIVFIRRLIPESPRWLMTHGRVAEAEAAVEDIEARIRTAGGQVEPSESAQIIRLRPHDRTPWLDVARSLLTTYPKRTVVGVTLMASQAFCYNAIFFTYGLVLTRFYGINGERVGLYLIPFAVGNFLGPLLLGHLFDSLGRRVMIAGTYGLAGILLAITGWLFAQGVLSAAEQTAAWTVIFFFASAAASACYLTVGESFPLEIRAVAIALFYAFGTGVGGVAAPAVFGALIASGSRPHVFAGYLFGAGAMVVAAIVEAALGADAERKSLEEVAAPLSLAD